MGEAGPARQSICRRLLRVSASVDPGVEVEGARSTRHVDGAVDTGLDARDGDSDAEAGDWKLLIFTASVGEVDLLGKVNVQVRLNQ